jgi:hypothetical protein
MHVLVTQTARLPHHRHLITVLLLRASTHSTPAASHPPISPFPRNETKLSLSGTQPAMPLILPEGHWLTGFYKKV